jgi:hypothetical protein
MFVILRDTFGAGLRATQDDLYVYQNIEELNQGIIRAALDIIAEDGIESFIDYDMCNPITPLSDAIVVLTFYKGDSSEYVQSVLLDYEKKQNDEEYQQYLRLKEKFES